MIQKEFLLSLMESRTWLVPAFVYMALALQSLAMPEVKVQKDVDPGLRDV